MLKDNYVYEPATATCSKNKIDDILIGELFSLSKPKPIHKF